ncbi:hypothetical protein RF11_15748 [Thelohanellus kitauei]|uniref:Uncharacterized protein n=1 Tax=Thelohanellus kitauei TaxID=669202 RepID=A0A0C2J817_THEKT|nr:hypothetical protein RF11_15748 [Thelohanellus kitauei]
MKQNHNGNTTGIEYAKKKAFSNINELVYLLIRTHEYTRKGSLGDIFPLLINVVESELPKRNEISRFILKFIVDAPCRLKIFRKKESFQTQQLKKNPLVKLIEGNKAIREEEPRSVASIQDH